MDATLTLSPNIRPADRVVYRHGRTTSSVPSAYIPYQIEIFISQDRNFIKITFEYEYEEDPKTSKPPNRESNLYRLVQGKYSDKLMKIEIHFSNKEDLLNSFTHIIEHLTNAATAAKVAYKEPTEWNLTFAGKILSDKIWHRIEENIM